MVDGTVEEQPVILIWMSRFEVRKKKSIHLKWREQSQSRAEQTTNPNLW
jgi:hypothetical protein